MFWLKILLLMPLCMAACSDKREKERNLEIVMEAAQSYTYNVTGQTYTVHNWNKPDTTITYYLSEKERVDIIDKYYALKLDALVDIDKETGNVFIKDKCTDMPKTYTRLRIKASGKQQVIQIHEACDNFYLHHFRKGKRVRRFINFIEKIIHAKPEMKTTPQSDMFYI